MIVEDTSTFWIGLDDTDEREYGCTTHDFNSLCQQLTSQGFTVVDPRLVRLWPFAPNRTRGNAALSAAVNGTDYASLESALEDWFTTRFSNHKPGQEIHSAQPVLILTEQQFPESIYWETVRNFVDLEHRMEQIESFQMQIWSTTSGLGGLIGASAAIAWRGDHDSTWECTAWRENTGVRHVPEMLVEQMSVQFTSTMLNRDPNAGRSLVAPRTPCPVLYGIRGESRQGVLDAHDFLQLNGAELSHSHRAHRTNQATDDHLFGIGRGIVRNVSVMKGGHVEIDVGHSLLAFSQGGDVNRLAQKLEIGDSIEWFGSSDLDGSIHLEKLRIEHGIRNKRRPICNCGSRYKSQGSGQLLRCPKCHSTHPNIWESDTITGEWVEPPASHRRHLSKPLSRMGKSEE